MPRVTQRVAGLGLGPRSPSTQLESAQGQHLLYGDYRALLDPLTLPVFPQCTDRQTDTHTHTHPRSLGEGR